MLSNAELLFLVPWAAWAASRNAILATHSSLPQCRFIIFYLGVPSELNSVTMVGHGWSLRTRSVSFAATMHRMRLVMVGGSRSLLPLIQLHAVETWIYRYDRWIMNDYDELINLGRLPSLAVGLRATSQRPIKTYKGHKRNMTACSLASLWQAFHVQ